MSYDVPAGNTRVLTITCARPVKTAWLGDKPKLEDCTQRIPGHVDECDRSVVLFRIDDPTGWHFFIEYEK